MLFVIYFAFISLGLPDSIYGAALPSILAEFGMDLQVAGIVSIVTAFGTILSSLFTAKLVSILGAGKVTAISIFLTSMSIIGISFAPHYIWIVLLSIPLGIGGGAVDSGLNNFVALNFKPHHLNFLHSFWGIGVTISPLILAATINLGGTWRTSYLIVGLLQLAICLLVIISFPLWKKVEKKSIGTSEQRTYAPLLETIKVKGVLPAMLCFVFYCGVESSIGNWGNSYLVNSNGVSIEVGASVISLFYIGITLGRLLSGVLVSKIKSKNLIRLGEWTLIFGLTLLAIPLSITFKAVAIFVIGFGCAPIFPSMLNETPHRFGATYSQGAISLQMGFAYLGVTLLSPLFGVIGQQISLSLLPYYGIILSIALLITSEIVMKQTKENKFTL
ncbi:MAG: MFS transporter [Clostridia bacterium]